MSTHAVIQQRYTRLSINQLGLWLFMISEACLFLAFIATRFLLLGTVRAPELNQVLGLVVTAILLASSLTAYRAESSMSVGERNPFLRNLLLTIGLGALFLVGLGFEWSQALQHFPPSTQYGSIFFSLTGLHGLHVVSGVVLLAIAYFNGRSGAYSPDDYWGVEGTVKYWHFVDVAWIFIYPTLYLLG
jgi:cytochrome c oxidase subunit 3